MASKNQTISLTEEEEAFYLSLCKTDYDVGYTDCIINGDAYKIMEQLPDDSIDLIIADPPYNLSKRYAERSFHKMNRQHYVDLAEIFMKSARRVLRPNGSIYICCDWHDSVDVSECLDHHFAIKNRITWQREKGRGCATNWKNCMEDIWYAVCNPKDYVFNLDAVKQRRAVIAPYKADGKPKDWEETEGGRFRDTCPSNFWDDISVPYWSMPENTEHPTQKPEKLAAKLILASSNPGGIILDPFLGSGTTAAAAKKLGRHFIGIELQARYSAIAAKRVLFAEKDKTIQGYAGGVFWERNTSAMQMKCKK